MEENNLNCITRENESWGGPDFINSVPDLINSVLTYPPILTTKEKIIKGVNELADTVKVTLGAKGKNVLFNDRMTQRPRITKDGVTVAKQVTSDDPIERMAIEIVREAAEKTVKTSGDGPQPLYSKILTPNGFTTMGELQVGDLICGTNSTTQFVEGIFSKGEKEIFKVKFSDGRVIECCEDHIWQVTDTYSNKPTNKTLTVKEIIATNRIAIDKNGYKCHYFYTPKTIVNFAIPGELIIDPYLLGALLGDGSLSSKGSIELALGLNDKYIIDNLVLPEGYKFNINKVEEKNYYRVKIKGGEKTFHSLIDELGLLDTNSHTKFIPHQYLYACEEVRRKVLQGMIDTDGYINSRGMFEYSTVSDSLKDDFLILVRSLGISINYRLKQRNGSSYSDTPIHIITELKGYKYGDKIVEIEATGEFTEMQCIKVSNSDSLYITDDFIVTHNTTTTVILAQYLINEGFKAMAMGKSFYELSRELDDARDRAIKYIQSNSMDVEANFEKLLHVATVSASDAEIGQFIYDIIQEIGVYGHIEVKSSHNTKDRIDKVKGIKYSKGFYAPQFLSDHVRMEWKASKVYIVLLDDTIRSMSDLKPYIDTINADDQGKLVKNNPILFIVNDVEPVVLQSLINNKVMYPNQFNIMITEHDGFGDRKTEIMNDIAALTSASRSTTEEPGQIGFAEEVIVDEDTTSILGGFSETAIVDELIEITKNRLSDEDISENDKVYYKRRLATLAGGVAVIHVGAPTEVAMKEKKDRIDDAVEAVKAAIDRGISVGGGYTFLHCSRNIQSDSKSVLLGNSLHEPFNQLCRNSDIDVKNTMNGIMDGKGYDVITNRFYELEDYTIYDPTGVLIDSLTNAVSVSKSILSIEKAIHNK